MGNLAGLGLFGIYTFDFEDQPVSLVRESIQELEELGFRACWFPEVGGREAFTHAGLLLASTSTMHVVNAIAQIGGREPRGTQGASALLAEAYPDRHVLGLGFGAARPGVKPLAAVGEYLDALDAFDGPRIRRILAAYGPKMLELARDRSAGAHTYHVNVAHTAAAREILGEAFLGVEHAVVLETDADTARAIARAHLAPRYLDPASTFNLAKFRRLGYTEDDISGGGSDRLVDDLVFWGDLDTIVAKLRNHVEAGADHVAVQVLGIEPGTSALPQWRQLAQALV